MSRSQSGNGEESRRAHDDIVPPLFIKPYSPPQSLPVTEYVTEPLVPPPNWPPGDSVLEADTEIERGVGVLLAGAALIGSVILLLGLWVFVLYFPTVKSVIICTIATPLLVWATLRLIRGSRAKAELDVEEFLRQPVEPSRRVRKFLSRDRKKGNKINERVLAELHEHPIVLIKWWLAAAVWTILAIMIGRHDTVRPERLWTACAIGLVILSLGWLTSGRPTFAQAKERRLRWLTSGRRLSWLVVAALWIASISLLAIHSSRVTGREVLLGWAIGMVLIALRFWGWWVNRFVLTDTRLILLIVDFRSQKKKKRNILLSEVTDEALDTTWLSELLTWLRVIKVPYGTLIAETASSRRVYRLPYAEQIDVLVISILQENT